MGKTKNGSKTAVGTIKLASRGVGYVRTPENKDGIEIPRENLNTAFHGDTVKVLLSGRGRGKVLEIIKRSKRGFAGELIKKQNLFFLKPSDHRMYAEIAIGKDALGKAELGDKIFVTLGKWDSSNKVQGKVEKVLGRAGEHEAEMQGIILERGFDSSFPPEVEREAEELKKRGISENEIKKRRDMRKVTTFTIDPYDAKDFDDALSFQKFPNGNFEVGIHIADVSHYVTPRSSLDRESYERATSVYLVDRTIPMLPEVLSNDLCSLNPNEDKLTFSAIFELDGEAKILKEWFGRTVIRSDKRFSYEEAQKVLDNKSGPFYDELETLNSLAKKLNKRRIDDGAIILETDEVKFRLDETGEPIEVFIKSRGDTNKLIEEFMLLANRQVAKFGSKDRQKKDRLFLYRIHDEPDKEKIVALRDYLRLLGYDLNDNKGRVGPKEFNRILKELEGKNEKDTVSSAIVRSMQKAVYSTKNLGHYGLAFVHYAHFTSPIRRYPDIIAHRLIDLYLRDIKMPLEKAHAYEKMALHCTEREIEAAEAERASIKYKQVEYMAKHVGEEFDGVVTGMSEWGIYAAEKTTRAEGFLRLGDITSDNFTYDEKKFAVIGRNSGRIIRIGEILKIKVKAVDVERGQIDYELVS